MSDQVVPRRVNWHTAQLGDPVWAPLGRVGWRMAVIVKRGRKLAHLRFNNGGHGSRPFDSLFWRNPRLAGRDRPPIALLGDGRPAAVGGQHVPFSELAAAAAPAGLPR